MEVNYRKQTIWTIFVDGNVIKSRAEKQPINSKETDYSHSRIHGCELDFFMNSRINCSSSLTALLDFIHMPLWKINTAIIKREAGGGE